MTQKEIDKVIRLHQKWLCGQDGGVHADLCEADLSGADLSGADTLGTNLVQANFSRAHLHGTDLHGVNLLGANFYGACLSGANLCNADLCAANFTRANFREADLSGANLYGTCLFEADLRDAKNIPYIPMVCPEEGSFIGWKRVSDNKVNNYNDSRIIKLFIPEDALRSSATTRKCRCSKAQVLDITDLEGNEHFTDVINESYNQRTLYKVGEMVYPDSFDTDRWNECSNGIHFFINKQEAMDY